jgi:hypothetical protein
MAPDGRISLYVGDDRWVRVGWYAGDDYLLAYAQFERAKSGQWRLGKVLFDPPTPEALRSFSGVRVENAVNAWPVLAKSLEESEAVPAEADVRAMFKRVRGGMLVDRPRLERPAGKRLGDDFYVQVAAAYEGALAEGLRDPRQTLARDSGAAPDTVARWIKEARRRGKLPETTAGRTRKPVSGRG